MASMDHCTVLRRLAVPDDAFVERLLSSNPDAARETGLDCRTYALIRIGALVAVDAETPSYLGVVEAALGVGATPEEIVGALMAVTPIAGAPRVVAAAPRLGLALGYDVLEALESIDPALSGGSLP